MWECRELQVFWKELLELTSKLFPLKLKCVYYTYTLKKERKLIIFCLLQAKCVIALTWKDPQRPDSRRWVQEVSAVSH